MVFNVLPFTKNQNSSQKAVIFQEDINRLFGGQKGGSKN
jgi:hypothetical protein